MTMPDREKVIEGLKELSGFLFKEYGKARAEEANLYYDRFLAADNAINLLKEQEAVNPIERNGFYYCGSCRYALMTNHQKYCSDCGRAVKWK